MKRVRDDLVAPPLMAAVCGLLLEFGEFSAVDVLRASGLLSDQEPVGRAEDPPPFQPAVDDPRSVRALLQEARDLAAHLGLEVRESDAESYPGVDDPDLDALLRST